MAVSIKLICIGKTNESFVKSGMEKYSLLLSKYLRFSITELPDIKNARNMSPYKLKQLEGEKFQNVFNSTDRVYLLDQAGREYSTVQFSEELKKQIDKGTGRFIFAIGGAFGFSADLKEKYATLSFGKMTFNHQMMRIILGEQLYRCFSIINGSEYHH